LKSCTTEIEATKVCFPEHSCSDIVFVDTPGFDDTNKSDGEILEMLAQWLKTTSVSLSTDNIALIQFFFSYERGIKLSGILYLHRISDNRMAGTPLSNLRVFQKLCGANALRNVILTTTMWDEVQIEEGDRREKELRGKYWKTMIDRGSTVARYLNTTESAWDIVMPILLDLNERSALELQREMVELKKQLPETKAGMELYNKLETLSRMLREQLEKIRAETGRSGDEHDSDWGRLRTEYGELCKKLGLIVSDMEALKLPLRKRLIHGLLSRLGLIKWVFITWPCMCLITLWLTRLFGR
jgi:hypothetical protein